MSTKTQLDRMLANDGSGCECFSENAMNTARAELAQLRADLQAAQERIAWLTSDIGESGLAAINRLVAACERGDIAQQAAPDLSIARDEILRQARQLDAAREIIESGASLYSGSKSRASAYNVRCKDWLAANPAPPNGEGRPEAEPKPISDVELAAYRCYLGESDDRLCELFESMPVDEGERYRKAHAQAEPTP